MLRVWGLLETSLRSLNARVCTGPPLPVHKLTIEHKGELRIGRPYTIILFLGNPKKVPLILGTPYLQHSRSPGCHRHTCWIWGFLQHIGCSQRAQGTYRDYGEILGVLIWILEFEKCAHIFLGEASLLRLI